MDTSQNHQAPNTHYLDLFINNTSIDFDVSTPLKLAIGNFDGIHRGHNFILNSILDKKDSSIKSLVISFNSSLSSIFNTSQKLSYFKELGLDYILLLPDSIRSLSYKNFLSFLKYFNLTSITVGENFRFGNNRKGSYLDLIQQFKDIVYIPPYVKDSTHSKIISSTRIKTEILNKNVSYAIDMLNHYLLLEGKIIPGIHEASSLGTPTINIKPYSVYIPKGVYIGYSYLTTLNNTSNSIESIQSLYDKNLSYKYLYDLSYKLQDSSDINNTINIVIRVHRFNKNIEPIKYITTYNTLDLIPSLIHIGGRPTLEKVLNKNQGSNSSLLVESHLLEDNTNKIDSMLNSSNSNYNYGIFYIKDYLEEEKTFSSKQELISSLKHYKQLAKNLLK